MAFEPTAFESTAFETSGAAAPQVTGPDPRGIATPRGALGLLDMFINPITLDYEDTDDGEWLETADSRTAVMIQIDTQLGKSYSAPTDGTRILEMLERGDPVTPELVTAEIQRALRVLELASPPMIRDVVVRATDEAGRLLVDETGRFSPTIHYTDLVTGSPVDLVYTPFQGVG